MSDFFLLHKTNNYPYNVSGCIVNQWMLEIQKELLNTF